MIDPEDAMLAPAPALLNCWKHHLETIRARLGALCAGGEPLLRALPGRLLVIGASQMDLYLGQLAPGEIARQALSRIAQLGHVEPEEYRAWLERQGGYALLELDDRSRWVLRWGEQEGRYVHLHPARYSPATLRMRASVLKTAIAALAWSCCHGGDPLELALVNSARRELLGLSPLRSLGDEGITFAINLIHHRGIGYPCSG